MKKILLCTALSLHLITYPAAQKPTHLASHKKHTTAVTPNKDAIPPTFNISLSAFDNLTLKKQNNLIEKFIQYNNNHLPKTFTAAVEHNLLWAIGPLLKKDNTLINTCYKTNPLPLCMATKNHYVDMVKCLLTHRALVDIPNQNGNTTLIEASIYGPHEIATLLLTAKANPNATNFAEHTPLICASANGHLQIVEALLQHGANLNAVTTNGVTPLSAAVRYNKTEIADMLMQRRAIIDSKVLKISISNGNVSLAQKIIDSYRAQLHRQHQPTFIGYTIKRELFNGFLNDIFQTSFNHSDNEIIFENLGQGHIIKNTENETALEFLMHHDHDLEAAFIYAAQNNMASIIPFLIEHGAHVDMHQNGWTALVEATKKGHEQIVDMLALPDTNIDVKNIWGWTPLMVAAGYKQPELVQKLLEKKANIHTVDEDGLSPLLWAAQNKDTQMMALLLTHNADIFSVDHENRNALTYALNHRDLHTAHAIVNLCRAQLTTQSVQVLPAPCPQQSTPNTPEMSEIYAHNRPESKAATACAQLYTPKAELTPEAFMASDLESASHESEQYVPTHDPHESSQEQFENLIRTSWQSMSQRLPAHFTHLAHTLLTRELEEGHLVLAGCQNDFQSSLASADPAHGGFITSLLDGQAPQPPPRTILKKKGKANPFLMPQNSDGQDPDEQRAPSVQFLAFQGPPILY